MIPKYESECEDLTKKFGEDKDAFDLQIDGLRKERNKLLENQKGVRFKTFE